RQGRLRARRSSASALPAGDAEAKRQQGDGGDRQQDGKLLAEEMRASRCRETRHANERDPRSAQDQRDAAQRGGHVATPHGGEHADGDKRRGDEQRGDQARAQRALSLTRHTAVAPARLTRTRAATASVASASWAKRRRPMADTPNAPPKNFAVTKSPRKAA